MDNLNINLGESRLQESPEAREKAPAGNHLLFHMCCGPCACICLKTFLEEGWNITAFWHNPNIHPLTEYLMRREAAEQTARHFGIPVIWDDESWDITTWLRAVKDNDTPPGRCAWCVSSRIEAAFARAREIGATHVFSSLLYSRYQPHSAIVEAGKRLEKEAGAPRFLYRDFRELWQAGIDLSRELGLYRQPYCGCIYSEHERYAKKLKRVIRESKETGHAEGQTIGTAPNKDKQPEAPQKTDVCPCVLA